MCVGRVVRHRVDDVLVGAGADSPGAVALQLAGVGRQHDLALLLSSRTRALSGARGRSRSWPVPRRNPPPCPARHAEAVSSVQVILRQVKVAGVDLGVGHDQLAASMMSDTEFAAVCRFLQLPDRYRDLNSRASAEVAHETSVPATARACHRSIASRGTGFWRTSGGQSSGAAKVARCPVAGTVLGGAIPARGRRCTRRSTSPEERRRPRPAWPCGNSLRPWSVLRLRQYRTRSSATAQRRDADRYFSFH